MPSHIQLPLPDKNIRLYNAAGDFIGYRTSKQVPEPSIFNDEEPVSQCAGESSLAILHCSQIGSSCTDGGASSMDVTFTDEHLNVSLPMASTPANQSSSLTSNSTSTIVNCDFELNKDESHVVLQAAVMEEEIPTSEWATKYAQEIANIIGDSPQLREFDKLRARLKAKKKSRLAVASADYSRHETLLANLQTLVITSKNRLKEDLAGIEADHVRRYMTLPTDASYEKAYRRYRHACALLRRWSITL